MSYNNGFISAPVSIYDVKRALGASSSDLGTLCRSAYVNKWAKYKPVPKNIINTTPQLNSDKTWKKTGNDQATWWKGQANNCGLSYTSQTSIGNVKTNIDAKRVVWSRIIPTGNYAEPYRLLDFNEYNHRAFPPTYALGASSAQMKPGETLKIQVATSTDDGYCIRFSHIGVFDNYYYTAAVYDTSGNLKFLFSAPKPIGQYADGESIEIEVPYTNGYSGILTQGQTYKAYVFISSHNYYTVSTSEAAGDNTYIPMPCGEGDYGMQPVDFLCKTDAQWAKIDAYCLLNGSIVNWTVDLYGAGTPSNTTLRLIHLNGTPVTSRESVAPSTTIDFSTGATAITSSDGRTAGWRKTSRPLTTLQLPSAAPDPELYKVEFVALNINTKAIIRRDLSPSV